MQDYTRLRLTFSILLVGVALMFTAVVTDHWAVLSPNVVNYNATCEAAHFGLWRLCTKRIYMQEQETDKKKGCGPISLPGEHNCSYFKHLNPGESSEIFEVTTQREYSISAAAIAIFSMDYLLRTAAMFYTFSGLCIVISVEVMRQSVKRMVDSEETVWIEYYYSWSFACACASFVLLFICGVALLLISLPRMPQNPWESCMDAEPEH
uniref:Voltage-dependent calcium channel gamma-1 subunit n=1 Tax=Sphenodon punctatus TaxID=8508 RepID=A0A8D0GW25_SPHPU